MPRKKKSLRRQVNFRLDLELYSALKRMARIKKITRTQFLTELIRHEHESE
jgi:uncharacterized protein (DUF1778 family)